MNAEQIQALTTQGVAARASALGTLVTIDGLDYTAVVSTAAPTLDLEAGGFTSSASFVVRIAKTSMTTPPEKKTAVVIDDITYRVISVRQSFGPLAQEWTIEVETA